MNTEACRSISDDYCHCGRGRDHYVDAHRPGPDLMDGGVTAALIEQEAEGGSHGAAPATRILTADEAAAAFTLWYDDTHWYPFVEDEHCNITGPGHQDKVAFAALVTGYDAHASGEPTSDPWTAADITHRWGVATVDADGEVCFRPSERTTDGALPITTMWGAR